jgi:hypothetical protein
MYSTYTVKYCMGRALTSTWWNSLCLDKYRPFWEGHYCTYEDTYLGKQLWTYLSHSLPIWLSCREPAILHDSHHVSLVQWTNLFASRHKGHRFKSPGGGLMWLMLALSRYSLLEAHLSLTYPLPSQSTLGEANLSPLSRLFPHPISLSLSLQLTLRRDTHLSLSLSIYLYRTFAYTHTLSLPQQSNHRLVVVSYTDFSGRNKCLSYYLKLILRWDTSLY